MRGVIGVLMGALLLVAAATPVGADEIELEILTRGLTHPWAVAFLNENEVLINERPGRVQHLELETGRRRSVTGVPKVDARGQGGLLDLVLHPDFADNHWVYLTWAGRGEGGNATHLGRARWRDGALHGLEVLFVATPYVESTKHFGSRMVFDDAGRLWMTVGDRGQRERAQDLGDHNGSVLRLTEDGKVPHDNPFVGRGNAHDAIYSYGHRNPQGAALHPETRRVWIHEHGPRGGDEINIPKAGANFGWPKATYGREYHGPKIAPPSRPGMQDPLHHWTPSIAPSGMAFYSGDVFEAWRGSLFVGALAKRHLARLTLSGRNVEAEEKLLKARGWRVRDVRQGPDGLLYVLTDAANGVLARFVPKVR